MNPEPWASQQWIGVVWAFGWTIVIIVIWYLKGKRNEKRLELIHKERIAAMDKGIPLPELPGYEEPVKRPRVWHPKWALAAGIVLIAGGAGTLLALRLSGDPLHQQVWSFGFIPIFTGAGLILQHWLIGRG